ncbi:MAG: DegT/DnrJ/EryC1/StrS family aminotransferase [Deltaproteobacteria bacterium]|nr:DegT/DnrJ/EryC1/StrS family aminotransferase [Deltaproteobacteria bacterium]
MQFIDLATQQKRIREKIESNIQTVLSHGQYILGSEIKQLEERLAEYVGIEHAVACSSGTDALLLALMAYDVGPGDAVLTSPFTFIATAEVISLLGATPVFADIDPETFNIDPEHLERALVALRDGLGDYPVPIGCTESSLVTKGIIAVDLFGLPVDYDAINAIAKKNGLFVIEDAAQSFGSQYKGKRACSLADIACTSFFPAKPLGGYGDGGMCFVDDEALAQAMRSFSLHGQGTHRYDNVRIGINGRMDTLQAAILHAKFDIFPDEVEKRQRVAEKYTELLSALDIDLVTPVVPPEYQSVWAQYSILSRDETQRSELQSRLKEAGIPTAVYYPKPLHLQPAFQGLGYREGDFPVSEDYSRRVFSLPMHPYLKPEEQEWISTIIGEEKGYS